MSMKKSICKIGASIVSTSSSIWTWICKVGNTICSIVVRNGTAIVTYFTSIQESDAELDKHQQAYSSYRPISISLTSPESLDTPSQYDATMSTCSMEVHYDNLTCPLTGQLFQEPTSLICGHTFSKAALDVYLQVTNRCPSCGGEADIKIMVRNMEREVEHFKKRLIKRARKLGEDRIRRNGLDLVPTLDQTQTNL